jgi:hypothetical protein
MLPTAALADGFNGFIDYTYNNFVTRTTDAAGQTLKTESKQYLQNYNMFLDKTILPKVKLDVAVSFQRDLTDVKAGAIESNTVNTQLKPYATLTLTDPLYNAGVGYYLRDQTLDVSRTRTIGATKEDYQAIFGWRPLDLPTIDATYTRSNLYGKDRSLLNSTQDLVSLNSQYQYRGLGLWYYGTFNDTKNKALGIEAKDVSHNGRGTYSGSFLDGRATVSASYNVIYNEVTTSSDVLGTGTVSIRVVPFSGLSTVTEAVTVGVLSPNPALIDSNLVAGSGINIGLPPLGGNTDSRNTGLDFLTVTEVNSLQVWVSRDLPVDISSTFSWDIYTSTDNLTWSFHQTVSPAPFGPFDNRFQIDFTNVRTRYVKVVVKPLRQTVIGASGFPDIFVTELQAFIKKPASVAKEQKFSSTTQVSNSAFQYRILNHPLLYYDASYYFTKGDTSTQENSTLSNGLSASHQFNRIISGTARVAREDGTEHDQSRTAYIYNASIKAVPLRTLTNTLAFSGKDETIARDKSTNRSLFLNTTAQLYEGVSLNLNGGLSRSTDLDGTRTDLTTLTVGADVVPNPTMTWSFYYTYMNTDQTRVALPDISNVTRSTTATLSFNPFRTLYLFGSIQLLDGTGQGNRIVQNYALNWAPFPDGFLLFRFAYIESRTPVDQLATRMVSPGLRFLINRRSFLDLSYQDIHDETSALKTDSKVFSAELKIFL